MGGFVTGPREHTGDLLGMRRAQLSRFNREKRT